MRTLTYVEINAIIREINVELANLQRTPAPCNDSIFHGVSREAHKIADSLLNSNGLNPVCFSIRCNHEGQRFIHYL